MAEWGLWDDELDEIMLMSLTKSYVRRKRWEQKLLANELAKIMNGHQHNGSNNNKVGANAFLSMTGVKIE